MFGVTTNANDPSIKVAYFNMSCWEFIRPAFYWLQFEATQLLGLQRTSVSMHPQVSTRSRTAS